ncbi:prepilin peptidase [Nitrincola tibetensis]|uniref:Prepilin leader peptidase/N-methyltransferase n=1 Tax=Nitrincola tibetensis TaxID=2219697 RepID=A0A364NQ64_9GAMM|nr:A24 family peptidase [Nitrincola tibetensis]RAU19150.1 prepilin peptidase [Nitrincola tibetensis]
MILFELFPAYTASAAIVAFALSLLVGSFLNVIIYRLPVMMEREWQEAVQSANQPDVTPDTSTFNLAHPRSRCQECGHLIRWFENIPVVSWLFLKGKCSQCGTSISTRYPLIEFFSACVGGFIGWQFGFTTLGLALLVFTWALIALTFIDIDHQLLPDAITLPLLWLGLLLNSFELITTLEDAVWGAMLGYLSLWSVYWLFKLATGKEGMGFGDFKLLAAIGAWGGVLTLPMTILFSSVAGVLFAMVMMAIGKQQANNPMPFGPYLAIAGWCAILWGGPILSWYL